MGSVVAGVLFLVIAVAAVGGVLWISDSPLLRLVGIPSIQSSGIDDAPPSDVDAVDAWDCFYEPTINDNWHDDVLCTNGPESERPILLADQDFVTEADMTQAGEEYEAELNG